MRVRHMRGWINLLLGMLLSLLLAASAVAHVVDEPTSHGVGAVNCTVNNNGKINDNESEKSAPHAHSSHCHHQAAPVDAAASNVPATLRDIRVALLSRPLDPAPSGDMLRPPRA